MAAGKILAEGSGRRRGGWQIPSEKPEDLAVLERRGLGWGRAWSTRDVSTRRWRSGELGLEDRLEKGSTVDDGRLLERRRVRDRRKSPEGD
jgi:hypothetical protein